MIRRAMTIGLVGLALALVPALALAESPKLESEDQKTLYALGSYFAERVVPLELSAEEKAAFEAGFKDRLAGSQLAVDQETWLPKMNDFATEREKKLSGDFVAKAAEREGATVKDSGLVIIKKEEGQGASPTSESTVKVNYEGRLRTGDVFDSTAKRGQPAEFPLGNVIPCWTEALQLMKTGGKATIICPASIAYGDTPPRGAPIPAGAALEFDVELIEIVK